MKRRKRQSPQNEGPWEGNLFVEPHFKQQHWSDRESRWVTYDAGDYQPTMLTVSIVGLAGAALLGWLWEKWQS